MSIYKLFGAGSGGTENDLASLDIQFTGIIYAVSGVLVADADADLDTVQAEISFLSVNTISTNDARGSIFTLEFFSTLITSGHQRLPAVLALGGLEIPVTAGERVHMHVAATASTNSRFTAYMYVRDTASPDLRRRR